MFPENNSSFRMADTVVILILQRGNKELLQADLLKESLYNLQINN